MKLPQARQFEDGKPPSIVAEILDSVIRTGPIAAALRQGADEIGMALRAFPDSIQTHEPGSVFNPLFSDIANDRRGEPYGNSGQLPTPSQIIANPAAYLPEQSQQNGPEQDHGRDL